MVLKHVIFDMDGVLFDSERMYEEGLILHAPKYGFAPTHEEFLTTVGTSEKASRATFLKLFGEFDYDALRVDIRSHIVTQMQAGRIPLKKGVHNLLSYLKQQGVGIALATSTRRSTVEVMLQTAQLTDYFDYTVCGDEVQNPKPDPEIFLNAMSQLGGTVHDTLVVEDSYNGVRAANAAGIPVVVVPDLLPHDPSLPSYAVKEDLDEVLTLFAPLIEGA